MANSDQNISRRHNYRWTLVSAILVFLIWETTLEIQTVYLENKIKASAKFRPANVGRLSASLSQLHAQNLELTWNHGQNKKSFPLTELTSSFFRLYTKQESWRLDRDKLLADLSALAKEVEHDPINARLEFSEEENRLKEFALPQSGLKINLNQSVTQIMEELAAGHLTIPLATIDTPPMITANSAKKLGITTLLAKGESSFSGSSASRIHNIKTGLTRFHGLLIKSGEDFSFNDNLGEVVASTGYKPELVIKNGKLVWEYGGGLCQVSTTLFRAAIYAGLPILERRPHAFPVRYYSPQGFDATIYPGIVDLRFKNDTAGPMLIQTKIIGEKLIFEIYGSSDARKVAVDGPHQYDQKSNGALKAYFIRTISLADGSQKEDKFYSSYRPLPPLEKNELE